MADRETVQAIDEWRNDFQSFINELQIPRDDHNGIMLYIDDGTKLLKAMEPKLLSLKELRGMRAIEAGAVWIESLGGGLMPAFMEIPLEDLTYFVSIWLRNNRAWFENRYYGITWRCWSARPTEGQRNAKEWNTAPKATGPDEGNTSACGLMPAT